MDEYTVKMTLEEFRDLLMGTFNSHPDFDEDMEEMAKAFTIEAIKTARDCGYVVKDN